MPTQGRKTTEPEHQAFWKKINREVNIFFKRINRQEVLTFLVFLCISAFFWAIETASEENDTAYLIEFNVENQPTNTVFTTQIPKQIKVTVKDKNINLINYTYSHQLDSLAVDFSRYTDAVGNFRISGAELQALLINQLFPSTQITSITPSLIDAKFAITRGKTVPVVLYADISAADNYRCLPPVLNPDSVTIHAPNAILDTITMITTDYYEAHGQKDTLDILLPLQLAVGVKSSPSQVRVSIPIARFVEKTITGIPVNITDVPNGQSLTIFPNRVDISCLVDFEHYSDISAEDFYLTASYNSIKSSSQTTIPVEIISYANPGLVDNIRLHTKEVEYIIEEE